MRPALSFFRLYAIIPKSSSLKLPHADCHFRFGSRIFSVKIAKICEKLPSELWMCSTYFLNTIFVAFFERKNFICAFFGVINLLPGLLLFLFEQSDTVRK